MAGNDSTVRSLIEAALAAGFRVDRTRKGHVRFTPPDPSKRQVIHSCTPGDWRAARNLRADLRRVGLPV